MNLMETDINEMIKAYGWNTSNIPSAKPLKYSLTFGDVNLQFDFSLN